MHGGRNAFVLQSQRGLHQTGHASGDDGVSEVTFNRADGAEAAIGGAGAEGFRQSFDLNRIAERSRRTVGFNITNAARRDAGVGMGHGNNGCLSGHTGRGETGLVGAIVVDCAATQHGVDLVAIRQRLSEWFQHHEASSVAKRGPRRGGIERTAMAIRRQHTAFLVQIAATYRHGQRNATSQSQIALSGTQRQHRLDHGDQRGRTRGMHGNRGTAQVESVRDASGDIIFFVGDHRLKCTDGLNAVGPRDDVFGPV